MLSIALNSEEQLSRRIANTNSKIQVFIEIQRECQIYDSYIQHTKIKNYVYLRRH